jgi:hypothetical protein
MAVELLQMDCDVGWLVMGGAVLTVNIAVHWEAQPFVSVTVHV